MANSVASLVVQTDLLPPQTTGSLSPFPSLLGAGEEDGERGEDEEEEEEEGEKDMMEGGEEVVLEMMTSAVAPSSQPQDTLDHPFQCPDCGKSFKWSSRLTHHQRSHNNERPYRCNLCPKAFKGSSALLYHQRSHSGDKPYKCDDCGKAFKRSSLLQVHSSVHTGLRAFQCPYCPLTFKWSSHYQYHLRQHTGECPYTCDSCPKAFKNSSSLRRHKNVHLGLKPYICSVCHKAFTQSTNLRQHMRIHTGERPYVCGDCGRSFTHSSNLALHRNSHSHTSEGKGPQAGGLGADGGGGKVEVMVGSEEVTSSILTDMVGFVSQEGAVGVEEVFLSHQHGASAGQGLPRLTLTHGREGMCTSRAIGTEVHVSTDTGASVLLYSCGSCSQTFSTCSQLQQHQGMHADMHAGPGEEGQGGAGGVGLGLVGAGHLLADFEEVVETTTVSENGHTAAELLGLTEGMDGGNVESAQAQFDLLQSFTAAVAQMPAEGGDQASVTVATGGVTPCAYCSKSFKTSGGLTRHLAQAHPPAPPQSRSQFSCSACDRSFPLLSSLLTHQHSHTPEQRLLAEAEAEIVCPPSLSLSLPLPSSPGQAHKQGDSQGEIHVSLIAVTQEEEEGEEEEAEGGQADRDQAKPPPRSGTKSQRRGGGGKASAGGNNERPYRCSECEKSFKGSSGLRYHMRDHTGERPYRCTECGKSFKRSSLLSIHQRVHTGVRAFQCPYCPLTFKWSSHYQYHLRQHTGERPYVCKECGKSFKNTSCLRRHSQMHSGLRPHTCSVCSKSFSQTSNLKQHERTHSGERPFQCSQCHKTFTHSSNLQLHLRTHSSRKDYKCPYCSKEFVMHSYLQRHIRTHANGTALMSGGGAKEVEAAGGKGGAGGLTTATLLNPITLETTGTPGSLIVSQPALDIPLNTSQNYFMIQTASGLQLIPLSAPTPAPPPPPQTHNYIVLQCPSSNGSQPSLILVPAATNPGPPTTDHQALPLVQTIPALQPVLSPAQTQIPHFQTVTQQPQATRFIITNNNSGVGFGNAPITTTTPPLSSNSLLSKPILGRSTRTARTRRGRKPKAASLKAAAASSQSGSGPCLTASTVTLTTTSTAANTTTTCSVSTSLPVYTSLPATAAPPLSSSSLSGGRGGAVAVSQSTSTPSSLSTMVTVTTPVTTTTQASVPPPERAAPDGGSSCAPLEEGQGGGKQYVLCFEKEEGRREQVQLEGEGGESYVLQFEGGGPGEGGAGGDGERESFVLRFKRDGEREGDGGGDVGEVVSLLQEWGGERPEGRQTGEEGGDGESYVLHFQTETQSVDENQANSSYPQGPDNSLELSCPPTQALLPLHGPGVVFELGEETKLEQEPGESMRMIALIEGAGGGGGGSYSPPGGEGRDVGAGMEGIYQIEGEEGIVIIEVSTSHLRDGGMHQVGEGGPPERREGKAEGGGGAEMGPDKKQKSEEGVGEASVNRTTHTPP